MIYCWWKFCCSLWVFFFGKGKIREIKRKGEFLFVYHAHICWFCVNFSLSKKCVCLWGGGQNLERPIFRNFKISNNKIIRDSIILFSNLIFHFLKILLTPKNLIIFQVVKYWFSKWYIFLILQIAKFYKILNYSKLVNYYIIS